ncbi:MAG: DNA mismatch repair endonuclease MutL [Candidatus Thermoplasmatota archaeon]|jgi:DNA mismatch repair protein MutL|nr:DNA mismatch repair endonuclease MutL [Candidatus Thermoplasmatota archaeon]MCL5963192.1 DNA mismatch repair endonuclease MutL [Candidatus Thermoplasmatota archaeon]
MQNERKLKKLDDVTIAHIAAGEVIDSPRAVIKELVENSIDADSHFIKIYLYQGGLKRIEVIDDGRGISHESLPLAIERYATSKITDFKDIMHIKSYGFRGEALASISSVSKMDIVTRVKEEETGSILKTEGGIIKENTLSAYPGGTKISVSDLFYNLPAREKHMHTSRNSIADITSLIEHFAMCNPSIEFYLYNDDNLIFQHKSASDIDESIRSIIGSTLYSVMLKFQINTEKYKIYGFTTNPSLTRSNTEQISIFVNKRWIYSKSIINSIRDGYGTFIPSGRYPFTIIFIDLDPSLYDVNIHPAKKEIRFYDEQEIKNIVSDTIRKTLVAKSAMPDRSLNPIKNVRQIEKKGIKALPVQKEIESSEGAREYIVEQSHRLPRIKIIGQMLRLFIVGESEEGMVLVDQHAASERIRYEELMNNAQIHQQLLVPVILELSSKQVELLNKFHMEISDIGFDIAPIGDRKFIVRKSPVITGNIESKESIMAILEDLLHTGSINPSSLKRTVALKTVACHSAIRGGDLLTMETIESLIKKLYTLDLNYSCPHGRPVMVIIDKGKLERLFLRS